MRIDRTRANDERSPGCGRSATIPTLAIIVFADARDAERRVAGVPAAARALREVDLAGIAVATVVAGNDWRPPAAVCAEMERLAPRTKRIDALPGQFGAAQVVCIAGDRLPSAAAIRGALANPAASRESGRESGIEVVGAAEVQAAVQRLAAGGAQASARLAAAERAIMRATGKPGDGIVSRTINRRISRPISTALLHVPGIRPWHATLLTAALGIATFATLLQDGDTALLYGALLFQAASIIDGVDGEIARATFRSSRSGATIDSLTDAATNLCFVLGVALNREMAGDILPARFGFAGLALLALGMVLIGYAATRRGGPLGFDLVKDYYRSRSRGEPSLLLRDLTFLTSRDFYALAAAVLIATGFAGFALVGFAVVAAGWLVAVFGALGAARA